MRVLVADDHPPTRLGIRLALEEAGIEVCAEVANASAAVDSALREHPDIALLDVGMPGDGIAAARSIAGALPDTAVVMLSVSKDLDDVFDALRAGASGYLLKDIDPDRLPLALQGVLNGEAALPRTLVTRVIDEFRGRSNRRTRDPLDQLTAREWEVLELMRSGLSTGQIADRLDVSTGTVRSHVSAVVHKLGVADRRAAVQVHPNG